MVRTVKKPEERRNEIIKAARRLFQTRDYEKTTMQELIESLGIAKGTVYYYFSSKEQILEAVIEDIVAESVEKMQKVIDECGGNALEKIRLLVLAGNQADDNCEILEQLHKSRNFQYHARLLAAAIQKQAPFYARLFEEGNAEGIFHTDHPLEAAEFILSAIQFLTDEGIFPWSQQEITRRMKVFPALMEAQLKAQPGSFNFFLPQNSENGEIK